MVLWKDVRIFALIFNHYYITINQKQMKKIVLLSFLLLFLTIMANAQLRVSNTGHVGIRALPTTNSILNVGADNVGNARIGIFSSPKLSDMNNIGVEGVVEDSTSYTNDTNFGVLGIITLMNN